MATSSADNTLLTEVGPGTPMGDLMRRYWFPALRADELPAPDCPPVRSCAIVLPKSAKFAEGAKHGLFSELGTDPVTV